MDKKSETDNQMPQRMPAKGRNDLMMLGGFKTAFIILAILVAGFLLALALRTLLL